jgi:heme exporter protein A
LAAARRDLVRTFSRGMQQRLAIGRAVLHDPEVLLLDEPHTGLDQDACAMLDDVLRQVAARGRTVVMTSHDLARAADLATRFDVLSRGVIQASVAAATCLRMACWPFIARRWKQSSPARAGGPV